MGAGFFTKNTLKQTLKKVKYIYFKKLYKEIHLL